MSGIPQGPGRGNVTGGVVGGEGGGSLSNEQTKQMIIASLFGPGSIHGNLIAWIRIMESGPDVQGPKPRYILLGVPSTGQVKLHKSKKNNNNTFSIGKTWNLEELKAVVVTRPTAFDISLSSKTYTWATDRSRDQEDFLIRLVRSYRYFTRDKPVGRLFLQGFDVSEIPGAPPPYLVPLAGPAIPVSSAYAVPPSVAYPQNQAPQREGTPPVALPIPSINRSPSTRPSTGGSRPSATSIRSDDSNKYANTLGVNENSNMARDIGRSGSAPPREQDNFGGSPARPGAEEGLTNGLAGLPPTIPLNASRGVTASPNSRGPYAPSPSSEFSVPRVNGTRPDDMSRSTSDIGRKNQGPNLGAPSSSSNQMISRSQSELSRKQTSSPTPSQASVRSNNLASPPRPSNEPKKGSGGGGGLLTPNLDARSRLSVLEPSSPILGSIPSPGSSPGRTSPIPGLSGSGGAKGKAKESLVEEDYFTSGTGARGAGQNKRSVGVNGDGEVAALEGQEGAEEEDMTLANVEEMLEGYEWKGVGSNNGSTSSLVSTGSTDGGIGTGGYLEGGKIGSKGAADQIEARLLGELAALEAASIHAIIESDDRVSYVIKHLDEAMAELDRMDQMISLYKFQLNAMADDISHIESQNRGLQLQSANQRALLGELENLLETIHIPERDIKTMTRGTLEGAENIASLEKALVSLYKAILSTRSTSVGDMAAASERIEEYRSQSAQFCKRMFDFLARAVKQHVDAIINDKSRAITKERPKLLPHEDAEKYLAQYCGVMLFIKEIDDQRYQQICAAYYTSFSDLHRKEVGELLSLARATVRKPTEEELEANFAAQATSQTMISRAGTMRRAGSAMRGKNKDKGDQMEGSEAFRRSLQQIASHVQREQEFVSDFLQTRSLGDYITFADFMDLETPYKKGAAANLAAISGRFKDSTAALEMIFAFLPIEIKDWIDWIMTRDGMQIVGVLAALDFFTLRAQKNRNEFLIKILQKQHQKSINVLKELTRKQIKAIEDTKLTLKKRKGVVPFIRVFPLFVDRIESQLEGADELDIRRIIDDEYGAIVKTMFECLQQMAKMDGEGTGASGEDKDQLNYYVVLIENMHHFVTVFSKQQGVASLELYVSQAKNLYDENLRLYIRFVLRRPLARLMDFFQGIETLLRTTPPTEVCLHSQYTKSSLKKTCSSLSLKELRKAVDALWKRVDKHFGDIQNPAAANVEVIITVWKACEEEAARLTSSWRGLIQKCYPEDNINLEFAREDVEGIFRKYKPTS